MPRLPGVSSPLHTFMPLRTFLARATGALLLTLLALGTAIWLAATHDDMVQLPDEPVWRQPLPAAHPPAGMRFAVMRTGDSAGALEALVVNGGRWTVQRHPVQMAVLVQHPQGSFLFDTGLGTQVGRQFAANTWLDRQFFAYRPATPAVTQLKQAGWAPEAIGFIAPSHMHWDHISGLSDFPTATVRVLVEEREGAERGHAPGFLRSQFADVQRWQPLTMDSGPWLGFARSQDLFGDGSALLVPLGGHTAGQVGLVLSLPSGRRLLFTGDVSWTMEGLRQPADRSWLLRKVVHVDGDEAANQRVLQRLHQLMLAHPELELVPAHDEHVAAQLPQFPHLQ
jgi:glyoxylase-like metal-dependent hydrolase (beta-lactamase superfamily II)